MDNYAPRQSHVPQLGYAPQQSYAPPHSTSAQPGYPPQQGYAPRPTYHSARQSNNGVRNRLIVGIVFAIAMLAVLLSGGDSGAYSDSGFSDSGFSEDSGGSSQIYGDSGSITTTDDGELIYSDSNGNSFSSGG